MTQAQKIAKAIKANFHKEDGTPEAWKNILMCILFNSFVAPQPDYHEVIIRHERLHGSNYRYRVKAGLVANYMKLM